MSCNRPIKALKGCSILVYTVLLRSFWHHYCLATCCQATCLTSVLLGKELLPSVLLLLTIVLRQVYVVCIHNPSALRELWEFYVLLVKIKLTEIAKRKSVRYKYKSKKDNFTYIIFMWISRLGCWQCHVTNALWTAPTPFTHQGSVVHRVQVELFISYCYSKLIFTAA